MKKILVLLCVICIMLVPSTMSINNSKKTKSSQNSEQNLTLLITEFDKNHTSNVTEFDRDGNILWQLTNLSQPLDAERLSNGNTLITLNDSVAEFNKNGDIVWEVKYDKYERPGLLNPTDAERLPNGNTLISNFIGWLFEVNESGDVVWEMRSFRRGMDAERLPNGNTLFTKGETYIPGDPNASGWVVEVDSKGNELWKLAGLGGSIDSERLSNNITLISEHCKEKGGNATEYDEDGDIVWQKRGLSHPQDVERLLNGNTLICETSMFVPELNCIVEVDYKTGDKVWKMVTTDYPVDVEILYNPAKPSLIAPKDGSTVGSYDSATLEVKVSDPDEDPMDVHFYDASDDSLIGTVTDVASDEIASIEWTGLDQETTYQWYAVASDSEFETPSDTWSFTTKKLYPPTIKIEITNPEEGYFYFREKPLFQLKGKTFVYGPITIKVKAESASVLGLEKIELYINNKLEKTFGGENHTIEYEWAPPLCGQYKIETKAYDTTGQNVSDSIVLFKWRFHPILILAGAILLLAVIGS